MTPFTVLIVDNDDTVLVQAKGAFARSANVLVFTADSVESARAIIKKNFLHVAFVDMHLRDEQSKNVDGKLVLRELAARRPSCKRFLLTKYVRGYEEHLFNFFHPLACLVDGAIYKLDFRDSWTSVVERMAEDWTNRTVTIEGLDTVFSELQKTGSPSSSLITSEEIYYELVELLKGSAASRTPGPEEIDGISLEPVVGGRSRSFVTIGRPVSREDDMGIWCVIKFGPAAEIHEEFIRYSRYVRLLVAVNRRVELLGYVPGDTTGLICYSFAGSTPDSITSLEQIFRTENDGAFDLLNVLLDPEQKDWYGETRQAMDLGQFFSATYSLDPPAILDVMHDFVEKVSQELGGRVHGSKCIFGNSSLLFPDKTLGTGQMRGEYTSCIVHGDMNAANVIVSDDGRVILIDYRHTQRGPVALDFAALEGSVRINTLPQDASPRAVIEEINCERTTWGKSWANRRTKDDNRVFRHLPYWAKVSYRIAGLARLNFPKLRKEEYALTCLLWGLRLFRVESLPNTARLRLFVWISQLSTALSTAK